MGWYTEKHTGTVLTIFPKYKAVLLSVFHYKLADFETNINDDKSYRGVQQETNKIPAKVHIMLQCRIFTVVFFSSSL